MAGEGAQGRTHWRGLPRLGSGLLGGGAGATPWVAQKLPGVLRPEEPSHWAIRKPPQGPGMGQSVECHPRRGLEHGGPGSAALGGGTPGQGWEVAEDLDPGWGRAAPSVLRVAPSPSSCSALCGEAIGKKQSLRHPVSVIAHHGARANVS